MRWRGNSTDAPVNIFKKKESRAGEYLTDRAYFASCSSLPRRLASSISWSVGGRYFTRAIASIPSSILSGAFEHESSQRAPAPWYRVFPRSSKARQYPESIQRDIPFPPCKRGRAALRRLL